MSDEEEFATKKRKGNRKGLGEYEDDDDEKSNLAMAALPGDSTCGSRASIEEGVPCLPSGEVLSGPVSPSAEYECTL